MTDIETELGRLLKLLDRDGIERVDVKIEVTPTVKKRNTEEVDDHFQTIRERVVSKDELEDVVDGTDWSYHGTIDAMGDFHVRDRFSLSTRIENDD